MMTKTFWTVLVFTALAASSLFAHCQMPCGIYGDDTRFTMLREDITTIEKAMTELTTLSAAGDKNYNQIVRWVNTKEEHAGMIIELASDYFLAQRVKPVDEANAVPFAAYQKKVTLLHKIIVTAMKCKQTTDLANVTTLRKLVDDFEKLYNAG